MRTLQQRGYVTEVARDPGPGQAGLFGTTRLFLERLGLDSVDDLPPLADFVPRAEVMEALEAGLRQRGGDAGGHGGQAPSQAAPVEPDDLDG
jgi:segregation and condensation protein B